MKRSFKTEVFLTIPLTFVALGCICASFLSNQWVSGSAFVENSDFEINYNYGLFWGQKTRITESTKSFDITVICTEGYCMFSCATEQDYRMEDLDNILSGDEVKTCDNSAASDLYFCEQKANCSNNVEHPKMDPNLMHMNTYAASALFVLIGTLFTLVSGIFSFYNVCHTPVELIWGAHGLVLWNSVASTCYFLVLCLYGAEFSKRLSYGAPISDLARPKVDSYQWKSNDDIKLGYPYALVGVCFAIHLIHVGMILYYIMKKYKPRQKNVEVGIDVDDKANGTAMIF